MAARTEFSEYLLELLSYLRVELSSTFLMALILFILSILQ